MLYLYRAVLSSQNALHVHKAAHITACDIFCPMTDMVCHPVFPHFDAYSFFGYTKSTAKATAFVLPVKVYQLNTFYHFQQLKRLGKRGSNQLRHLGKL